MLACLAERRVACMVLVGKREGHRALGKVDVDGKIILKGTDKKWVGAMEWIDLFENSDRWCALINEAMNNLTSIKCGEFLN